LKLLYVASDQTVPGTTGGSVHVDEVARGLASRGHEVHVLARPGELRSNGSTLPYEMHESPTWLKHRWFRWTARHGIERLLQHARFDAVLERYYNFAGEGVRAAYNLGIPSLLEVNSPLRDHDGSWKARIDRILLVRPLKRLRDDIARKASALVTPLREIVPDDVPEEKVNLVSWGANVDRFRPDVEPRNLGFPSDAQVVVFSGSFRPWHGADVLVRAARRILDGKYGKTAHFLLVGSGPSLRQCSDLANDLGVTARVRFTGAVHYREMPYYLACACIGVAPYQPSRLSEMSLGFYWSPLKVFEYMAMAIPVVTLDAKSLAEIVRPGQEGWLVPENDEVALAAAIEKLLADPETAKAMGGQGRRRVVSRFSWAKHCEQLESILETLVTPPARQRNK
jgi:glycosyltransferase involved in cell wall biosynthesis